MKLGLLYEDEVIDVITPPAGMTISDMLPDDRASQYESIPSHVTVGYTRKWDGTWIEPKNPSPIPVALEGEAK